SMNMVSATSISDPLVHIFASSALCFVLYVASLPEVMQPLSAGTITVVFSSMMSLLRPLKSLTNVNAQFQRCMAACQPLFTILVMEPEKDDGTRRLEGATGDIEFRNGTCTYPTRETPALKDISCTVPAGKTVALVVRSGSGKSTIAN
ncbi:lipid ABC transporter permease/ATP-binding protein, partial [Plesiomonas shigelloides]|nr:lipid ABC transporter permease/ATP-binding protein [Plesiomonas shigelloides]